MREALPETPPEDIMRRIASHDRPTARSVRPARPALFRAGILSAAALLLSAAFAWATTFTHLMDLAELCDSSPRIVSGRVVAVRSEWTPNHSEVITWVTVQVTEDFKGDGGGRVTVATPGGAVGGLRRVVDGAPTFVVGEEAVLFFNAASPSGACTVRGGAQGKFDIVTDPETGERLVQRMAPGLAFRDLPTLRQAQQPEQRARVTYGDFTRRVRTQVEARGER